jgi:predicted ATPase
VLDNCEHVLDAAAGLAAEVLDRCPDVAILATSREPLDVDGEQIVPVRPLDPSSDAVFLFAERARAADPDFVAGGDASDAIDDICRRLDGVPLAVELAAARVDTMTVDDIARRLDDRFRLLSSGRRRSVERHQTLRATLEWSHQLLADDEQVLLRRLGVFAGGFPRDAVAAVCSPHSDPLTIDETLASLVRRSLVEFERQPKPGRYRLLETVRAFALEQLAAAGEAELVGRSHAEWIASLVDHPIEVWYTEGGIDLGLLRREFDNWRDAVNFALSTDDAALARRLTFHILGADTPETARWTEAALQLPGIADTPRAHWLHWALLPRYITEMDLDALPAHIAAFEAGCRDERELGWSGSFNSGIAILEGRDAIAVLDERLAIPNLSDSVLADLYMYRAFYLNMGQQVDLDAAQLAVDLAVRASSITLPVAMATLAYALSATNPQQALDMLRDAETRAMQSNNAFIVASVASYGARALLSLPDPVLARELQARLELLQPIWNNAAVALFTICVSVLRRVDHPLVPTLHSFIWSTPGARMNAQTVDPTLGEPAETLRDLPSFDELVVLLRDALRAMA